MATRISMSKVRQAHSILSEFMDDFEAAKTAQSGEAEMERGGQANDRAIKPRKPRLIETDELPDANRLTPRGTL